MATSDREIQTVAERIISTPCSESISVAKLSDSQFPTRESTVDSTIGGVTQIPGEQEKDKTVTTNLSGEKRKLKNKPVIVISKKKKLG